MWARRLAVCEGAVGGEPGSHRHQRPQRRDAHALCRQAGLSRHHPGETQQEWRHSYISVWSNFDHHLWNDIKSQLIDLSRTLLFQVKIEKVTNQSRPLNCIITRSSHPPLPPMLSSITPSFPLSGPVLTVVLGGEWAEQQRGDSAPRGLPPGTRGGRQSSAGGWGQVRCDWWRWLPHPQCHEVQWEGVSRGEDEDEDLQHGVVLSFLLCVVSLLVHF